MIIRRLKNNKEIDRFNLVLSLIFVCSLAGLILVVLRAFQFQIIEHESWKSRYEAQIFADRQGTLYRRPIVDRNGVTLALSVEEYSLFANPKLIGNPDLVASQLSKILNIDKNSLLQRLKRSGKFVPVVRFISDERAQKIESLRIDGLYLVREMRRFYPYRHIAGQVIGFAGLDGQGLEGIEKEYNKFLVVPPWKERLMRDGITKKIWFRNDPPPTFKDEFLALTIDSFIQYVTEKELAKVSEKYTAESSQVIVMDAKSFEVLAMANWPFFDPNLYQESSPKLWRNRAITDQFEPGSTFKAILAAALLEENFVKPTDKMFCENGVYRVPGHTIRDVHPHGWIDFIQVIQFSSNICAAKLALGFGAKKYFDYIEKFGFGKPTGIDLPGEASGTLRPWDKWQPLDLATSAFGQGMGVTVIQLARAFGAIANGGYLGEPRVTFLKKPEEGIRILSPSKAEVLRLILNKVTEEGGTGVLARVPGYRVGGKTGTAQKMDPATGGYSRTDYASIFVGFAPLEDPKVVIAVVVHNPKGATYGGVVAGPVFREIALRILPYLGIPPSEEHPSLEAMKVSNVRKDNHP